MLVCACNKSPESEIPPLRLTLNSKDAAPFGGKVLKEISGYAFDYNAFVNNAKPFTEWYVDNSIANYHNNDLVYMLATPYLSARRQEAEDMLRFVKKGNTLMIFTNGWTDDFAESFDIDIKKNAIVNSSNSLGLTDTHKKLVNSYDYLIDSFPIFLDPFIRYLETDSLLERRLRVISHNEQNFPDGLQIEIGDGELIVVTNVGAFTNYALLTGNNHEYLLGILSYLNTTPDELHWDEFYHRNINRQSEGNSILGTLLSIPPLSWAFWILLALTSIWVFNNMIRRQRMIPVADANKNTTIEFTQTIARLYYNQKDNRNIALKMIQHFMEHIRAQHYLPQQKFDRKFAELLASKTNQSLEETLAMVERMAAIQASGDAVSDETLLILNREITQVMHAGK